MDKTEKKKTSEILILILSFTTILLVADFCYRASLMSEGLKGIYSAHLHGIVNPNLFFLRIGQLAITAALGWINTKLSENPAQSFYYYAGAVFFSAIFINGYTPYLYINLYLYPLSFVVSSIMIIRSVQEFQNNVHSPSNFKTVPKSTSKKALHFTTKAGILDLPEPAHGTYIESSAGGGKSNLIENFLWQEVQKGKAGFLYDYEGNPLEKDGAVLTKAVYTALKQTSSSHKVKFAFINFTDLTKTVRPNPINTKYLRNELDILNASNTLMKNLERDWIKKTDFWASNAINYTTGCMLYQLKHFPKHMQRIPHLICLMLSDFRAVINMLMTDESLSKWIIPIATAYKMEAHQQTAGVVSSTQLPITKLFLPEIFWVLNPPEDEEFDLDITNPNSPVFLCVGNNPKQRQALSPVISLIFSVVKNNIDKLEQCEAVVCIDEAATCYFNQLDEIPATMRKKGVSTIISVQTFIQLIRDYGKENAETLRDNCSNQFIGKTNNRDAAHRIVDFFGDYSKREQSQSSGDSGESTTLSLRDKKLLQLRDVTFQQTGHWSGYISNTSEPMFHTQFDQFKIKKLDIPHFSAPINSPDSVRLEETMRKMVLQNFTTIQDEVSKYILPYMPVETE